jgi:pilus assembly protein CpaF
LDLVGQGLLSQPMADFLELALRSRRNIVISGPPSSGRSTLLAALARTAVESERVVSVEETEELELGDGQWISLVGHGAAARHAIANALRLRPERLVVGDLRGAETLDILTALAGGTDGVLCVVQASSAREALSRIEALAKLAPEAPPVEVLRDEVARNVQLVVQLQRSSDGEPRVGEIAEVTPGPSGASVQAVFTFKPDASGGRFQASGHAPSWAEGAPPSLFRA